MTEYISEYKQALDYLSDDKVIIYMDFMTGKTYHTNESIGHTYAIRKALKIADKLMQEPSQGMLEASDGWGSIEYDPLQKEFIIDTYNAMRDQLIKEVESQ